MKARILEIIANTMKAIENSQNGEDQGPYAYHNFVKGFTRYDGKVNRGSFILELTTWEDTMEFIKDLDWEEMTQDQAIADGDSGADTTVSQYFRATVPKGLNAFQGGTIYKNLSEDAKELVMEVQGHHGPELVIEGASMADFEQTSELRLIVSRSNHKFNPSGLDIIATWFPGTLAPPSSFMSGREDGGLEERFVKLSL